MVIQHNMSAMNASGKLNITTGRKTKASEKLASGYKINRAGNDVVALTRDLLTKTGAGAGSLLLGDLDKPSSDFYGLSNDTSNYNIDPANTQFFAYFGAMQNRLEHTIANLDTTSENTQAAESRIRDTDMAREMVAFSIANVLEQAGQSMLAQANQSTQGIFSLLQ